MKIVFEKLENYSCYLNLIFFMLLKKNDNQMSFPYFPYLFLEQKGILKICKQYMVSLFEIFEILFARIVFENIKTKNCYCDLNSVFFVFSIFIRTKKKLEN